MAATVETVSRVGPCEAEVKLIEIRDVRETKRQKIIERATELLKEWDQKSLEPSEIEEQIETDIKLSEITSWGPEELPAGPEVESDPDLIIVEGRADVLNLLRIGVKNAIAVQGTQVPKSIIDLSKTKNSVTAFLDGDRGGTIILNELIQLLKLDYVARAPEGYEVEELTRKQLIKSLQNKKPAHLMKESDIETFAKESKQSLDPNLQRIFKKLKLKNQKIIIDAIKNIEPGYSIGFDKNLKQLFEFQVGELYDKIREHKETQFLVIDGILTKRLLTLLIKMKIKFVACKNKEEDLSIPMQLNLFYF